ncbi:MAG TPA: acyl-CoA dehydrogenase family protein [Burkholderiaceae bacterium]|nr:acyl-CoA dehydrogenase family protein [Burkholderiaceae bacterium]
MLPYADEHHAFRRTVRRFVEREIAPHHAAWERDGQVPRALWRRAGELGLLCTGIGSDYGGAAGPDGGDFLFAAIVVEELSFAGATGPLFQLHSDIVAPYIDHYGSAEQKARWLPPMARGETISAICMTEPGAGSDLAALRTTARRDGDDYVIDGQKIFISNGQIADLFVVAAKTDPAAGASGVSLLLVEADRAGFGRGRRLEKLGLHAQDTSELFFDGVRVPASNLLGEPGRGFKYLMQQLPQERLLVAIAAVAASEAALAWTVEHVEQRQAFGAPLASLQTVRHALAEVKTEIAVGRAFLDQCTIKHRQRQLDNAEASMAKWWLTEMQFRVIDRCLQLFGGYGYMREFPIARAWADARVQRIYGGTTEIMKEIVSRAMFRGR